jgi:IclR family transcriptional regulator, KDG regulon repressor
MKQKRYSSLENALRILELFRVEKPDYSVKEVAEQLSIGDSTAHRLLTSLQKEGFISKDDRSNRYRLGISIRAIESVIRKDLSLYNVSRPILLANVKKVGETMSLCVLHRNQTFYMNTIDPTNDQMLYIGLTYIGKRQPVLSTSAGKVLLCNQEIEEVQRILSLEKSSLDPLMAELQQINKKEYAISYNNFSSGITSISAPIKNKQGEIIAAVEVIGPEQRLTQGVIPRYIKQAKEAAAEIEIKIGMDVNP